MWTLLQIQQGQLISNGLLGTLNSSKNEQKNRPNIYEVDIWNLIDLYDVPVFYLPEILNFFNSAMWVNPRTTLGQSYFVLSEWCNCTWMNAEIVISKDFCF